MKLQEITNGITTADRILIIVLVIFSALGFIFIKKAFPKATEVRIEVNGKPVYVLPLTSDTTISVKGEIGDTIVEVKDKKVRIKESPCPNKICIHNGWVDRGAVICLPNRVMVFINSPEDTHNTKPDAITG
ncbi:MAG: NusG domain II-containing protein [Nitrospirae bacterium]|nr:NusG domain II-containing protein [Nitrospirota bacterium]